MTPTQRIEYKELEEFIIEKDHPCVMAQAAFKHDHVHLEFYDDILKESSVITLYGDLKTYLHEYNWEDNHFNTFIAAYPNSSEMNELKFEEALWNQLQALQKIDKTPWDASVSDDPNSHDFSFSVLGHAFYIVGMHPNSSRKARQSPYPLLVFNLHHQFERLREFGTYKFTRNTIRKRDRAMQGSVNPMLTDFGKGKEAMQYSGRKVKDDWECPFHTKEKK